jgi:hypothetical protein
MSARYTHDANTGSNPAAQPKQAEPMTTTKPKQRTASTVTVRTSDPGDVTATAGQKIARHVATMAPLQAAGAMEIWVRHSFGDNDLGALIEKIREQTNAMHAGDMKDIEAMLFTQALTLQATFTALSRRAAANSGEHMVATDTYLRLALKAQGQCRATLETLANIKNPRPVAFVRQANIAHGPQQVNNGTAEPNDTRVRACEETEKAQNELLANTKAMYGKPLDTRATSKAGRGNSLMATVETSHRAANDRR